VTRSWRPLAEATTIAQQTSIAVSQLSQIFFDVSITSSCFTDLANNAISITHNLRSLNL